METTTSESTSNGATPRAEDEDARIARWTAHMEHLAQEHGDARMRGALLRGLVRSLGALMPAAADRAAGYAIFGVAADVCDELQCAQDLSQAYRLYDGIAYLMSRYDESSESMAATAAAVALEILLPGGPGAWGRSRGGWSEALRGIDALHTSGGLTVLDGIDLMDA